MDYLQTVYPKLHQIYQSELVVKLMDKNSISFAILHLAWHD